MPADVGSSPTLFEDTDAEIMLLDGSWVWCRVIGERCAAWGWAATCPSCSLP